MILGEFLEKTSLPDGAFSILPCHLEDAPLFSTDERLKMVSFTGSAAVGWKLKNQCGMLSERKDGVLKRDWYGW